MIDRSPFWKRPGWILVLVMLAVAAGAWLALDRPVLAGWGDTGEQPIIRLPEFLQRNDPERLFCAESADTGACRCIASDGQRPEISDQECRRRARASETRTGSD